MISFELSSLGRLALPSRARPASACLSRSVIALTLLGLLLPLGASAQQPPADSPGGEPHRVHALVGARIVPGPGELIERGTVLIRDGVIEAVGAAVVPPADAREWDMRGMTIYAGLIEPYLRMGTGSEAGDRHGGGHDREPEPAAESGPRGALHENARVTPEHSMATAFEFESEELEKLRGAGLTSGLLVPDAGIFRGTSVLINLGNGTPCEQVIRADVAQHVAYDQGDRDSADYPSSLQGAMAVVRQVLLDAGHHAAAQQAYARRPTGQRRPETNQSLAELSDVVNKRQPVMVEAEDAQMVLRTARLFGEFGLRPWVVTGGCDAYRWLDQVRATGLPLVVSVNVPPTPKWEDDDERVTVGLESLRHWQLSRANPRLLHDAGAEFCFTTQGLEDRADFRARVRESIARGLPAETALAAFTTRPAALLGVEQQLGRVIPGAIANLTVTDGELFGEQTEITEVWIDGDRYDVDFKLANERDATGTWSVELEPGRQLTLEVAREKGKLSALSWLGEEAGPDSTGIAATGIAVRRGKLRVTLPGTLIEAADELQLVARLDHRRMIGEWQAGSAAGELFGTCVSCSSEKDREREREKDEGRHEHSDDGGYDQDDEDRSDDQDGSDGEDEETPDPATLTQRVEEADPWPPAPEPAVPAVLVRNATVWTLAEAGIVEEADLLCRDGKVVAVGRGLQAPAGAVEIDGTGRHVTPGIIDCHSHSFISGAVNECTFNCTAEVGIEDVVDAETTRIYQQLAGGVTTSQQLHGSCNAIGGKTAVVKLRWTSPADAMLFAGATPGVKFALGENVKRAGWENQPYRRYPNSRMGIEQSIRERFIAAREYMREHEEWGRSGSRDRIPPRRDLQLETLADVLRGERSIHCHAYRQDEVLMMIRVAEEFGIQMLVFQHILEGYKVADEMAAFGAGASAFSDWWAYKIEVYDAIPYNGAIMWERGVLVTFNSDSSELARRLNLEAAKAVRYGGVPEEEALKFVSLNAAIQLGIDDRVGSLEAGKDADFTIWNGHPMHLATVCEETWLDGRRYFQRQRDQAARVVAEALREELLDAAVAVRRHEKEVGGVGEWRPTFGQTIGQTIADQASGCRGEGS